MSTVRTIRILVLAVMLLFVACGDDGVLLDSGGETTVTTGASETPDAGDTSAPALPETTTAPPSSGTGPPEATTSTETTAAETATSTTVASPTAADTLAPFFAAAEDLDRRIRDAAEVFNAGFDSESPSLDPGVGPVVYALDAGPLRALIPGGMSEDLERAVLAVYADLDSRISSLAGGARAMEGVEDVEWALDCLGNGSRSFDRYPDDLAEARRLADLEAPPTAGPDDEASGIVAVRLEAIRSMNWGCDSCGGVEYDEPFAVDWPGRTIIGVEFDATFAGGVWEIMIYAC